MKWLSIAALAWLAAGCATTADRYGSYQYPDEQGYYEVDEVVYGGRAGYSGYYGPGYVAYDPYWGYSGFAYFSNWPSYYVYAPYYDPFYVSSFGFAPVHYYSPYRRYGSVSFFGYYDPFFDPWYSRGHYYYVHHGHHGRHDRFDRPGHFGRGDHRDDRFGASPRDPGLSARNEARRLTTTRQPLFRTPPKVKEPAAGDTRRTPRQAANPRTGRESVRSEAVRSSPSRGAVPRESTRASATERRGAPATPRDSGIRLPAPGPARFAPSATRTRPAARTFYSTERRAPASAAEAPAISSGSMPIRTRAMPTRNEARPVTTAPRAPERSQTLPSRFDTAPVARTRSMTSGVARPAERSQSAPRSLPSRAAPPQYQRPPRDAQRGSPPPSARSRGAESSRPDLTPRSRRER